MWPGILSIESHIVWAAEAFSKVEGNMFVIVMVRREQAHGVEDPMDARTYPAGTWDVFNSPRSRAGPQRKGACAVTGDARVEEIR